LEGSFAKETRIFEEPTNRSHPIERDGARERAGERENVYIHRYTYMHIYASESPCLTGFFCRKETYHPLTKEIRLKIFDPIISNSFPVRYYGISGTNLPDIP